MSDLVSLTNPGLIPMEAVTTMGVSAKEGDNPIGFFGTGLKYAVASLLRTGQKITIWRGLDRYDFAAEPGEVRGKAFDFIRMTGPEGSQRLGFTTHLGAQWEPWQIFRELYSNCLDEAGSMSFSAVEPADGCTTIRVTGAAFCEAARMKHKFFLSTRPLYADQDVEIHTGATDGIYYRGVLVSRTSAPMAYTYNLISPQTLTEDRTLKHGFMADHHIQGCIAKCPDKELLGALLQRVDAREKVLTFSNPGDVFAETALELAERYGVLGVLPSAVAAAELWAKRNARVKAIELSPREAQEVDEARAFLDLIGYPVTAPVIFTESLGAGVYGMARHGTIYITRSTIIRGGNFLIGTLLEEQLHLSQGLHDETRPFQDFLLDLAVKFAKEAHGDRRPARPAYDKPRERSVVVSEVPF